MDIRTSYEGLKSILGVNPQPASQVAGARGGQTSGTSALSSDRATLSSAGSEVLQTAGDEDVRMDKVAGVQAALAAGTYNVPATAVASRIVDAMLGGDK